MELMMPSDFLVLHPSLCWHGALCTAGPSGCRAQTASHTCL